MAKPRWICCMLCLIIPPTATAKHQQCRWIEAEDVQQAMRQSLPMTAPLAAHVGAYRPGSEQHWDLIPAESRLNVAVSAEDGFYSAFADERSPLGLSRIWPYMIEDVPWGALQDVMYFQEQRSVTERAGDPPPDLPDGIPPHLHRLLQNPKYTWYVNGQFNDEMWSAVHKKPGFSALVERLGNLQGTKLKWDKVNLWASGGGTVSNLHFDPSDNWLCQFSGTKNVTLFSPLDSHLLYPVEYGGEGLTGDVDYYSTLDEGTGLLTRRPVEASAGPDRKIYAGVNADKPDLEHFPEFSKASPMVCEVRPGECVWIPQFWWHNVKSKEGELNLSLNFWHEVSPDVKRSGFDVDHVGKHMEASLQESMRHLIRTAAGRGYRPNSEL